MTPEDFVQAYAADWGHGGRESMLADLTAMIAETRREDAMLARIEGNLMREQYGSGHVTLAGERIATAIEARG